jgi:hypothetical protein
MTTWGKETAEDCDDEETDIKPKRKRSRRIAPDALEYLKTKREAEMELRKEDMELRKEQLSMENKRLEAEQTRQMQTQEQYIIIYRPN